MSRKKTKEGARKGYKHERRNGKRKKPRKKRARRMGNSRLKEVGKKKWISIAFWIFWKIPLFERRKRNACLWEKPLKEKKVKIPLLMEKRATGGIGDEKRKPIEPLENDQKEFSFL